MVQIKSCKTTTLIFTFLAAALAGHGLANRHHILFLVIDDLGWNDVSFHGAEFSTPTIDELAYSGVILNQYYVQPFCSPTRSALLGSRYPYHTGLAHIVIDAGRPMNLPLDLATMPEVLQQAGYQTHAVGKWDIGYTSWNMTPTSRGFDTFFGYYIGAEDYYTHSRSVPYNHTSCAGVDLRNGTTALLNQSGIYSTFLFTSELERIIHQYQDEDDPLFLYAAYQAVHDPLEAPEQYIKNTECALITNKNRQIFCGMMKVLDEGIANVTAALKKKGILDDTMIVFTTDNGGQTSQGGNNWPLRGNKVTVWEGGIRGTAFVAGAGVPHHLRNTTSNALLHVTDWMPTLAYFTGAHIDEAWRLDGVNQFGAIFHNESSARDELLLNLDPAATYYGEYWMGQAAIRVGDWKLITGIPNCSLSLPGIPESGCASGWVYVNGTMIPPPPNPTFIWLFNITADPFEQNDVSQLYPDVVAHLQARIEFYNSTHVEQAYPPFDPRSCPSNFNPPSWTPWLE